MDFFNFPFLNIVIKRTCTKLQLFVKKSNILHETRRHRTVFAKPVLCKMLLFSKTLFSQQILCFFFFISFSLYFFF